MFNFFKALLKSTVAVFTGIPLFCAVCSATVAVGFVIAKTSFTNIITLPFGKDAASKKNARAKVDPSFDAIINFFSGAAIYCLKAYPAVVKELKEEATSKISASGYAKETSRDSKDPAALLAMAKDVKAKPDESGTKPSLRDNIKENRTNKIRGVLRQLEKIDIDRTARQNEFNEIPQKEIKTSNPLVNQQTKIPDPKESSTLTQNTPTDSEKNIPDNTPPSPSIQLRNKPKPLFIPPKIQETSITP